MWYLITIMPLRESSIPRSLLQWDVPLLPVRGRAHFSIPFILGLPVAYFDQWNMVEESLGRFWSLSLLLITCSFCFPLSWDDTLRPSQKEAGLA